MDSRLRFTSVGLMLFAALIAPGMARLVLSNFPALQPDECGRSGLPCCPGFDAVGMACQTNCSFTACLVPGFEAYCEKPVEGDPELGESLTICRGCGAKGLKCCDDTDLSEVGSCGSRNGPAICTATLDGPMCLAPPETDEELVPLHHQCGGYGYNGPTTCELDLVCIRRDYSFHSCEPGGPVPLHHQCGGWTYHGKTMCDTDLVCNEVRPGFSQCEPRSDGVVLYGQCGGTGYTGPTECLSGGKCVSSGPSYSQCQP